MKVIKTIEVEEEVEVRPLQPGERLKEGDLCRLNCHSNPPGGPVNAPAGTEVESLNFYYRPIETVRRYVKVCMDFRELEDDEVPQRGDYYRHRKDDINQLLTPLVGTGRANHPIAYLMYYRPVED